MNAWGHTGRLKYLIIEAIDLIFYHNAYRLAFLVIINRLMDAFINEFPKYSWLVWLGLVPVILSRIDVLEDAFQVLITLFSDADPNFFSTSYFAPMVRISSVINQTKWIVVRTGSIIAVIIGVLTISSTLFRQFRRPHHEKKSL
jgi:hypothetical protein